MKFGSLFSGIGGLDLGLERAGMTCSWQSEIEPYACRVLAKHWPNIPNLGDIRDIDWTTVDRVDLVAGGYPCQPFSAAGRRNGQDDPRHLWPMYAHCIRVLRPRYALLENVAGHLSLGFGSVLADLAALGYDAQWDCIPAAAVGAPHLRDRVFVIARDMRPEQSGNVADGHDSGSWDALRAGWHAPWHGRSTVADAISASLERRSVSSGRQEKHAHPDMASRQWIEAPSDAASVRRQGSWRAGDTSDTATRSQGQTDKPVDDCHWRVEPDVGRVADGIPHRVDRLRGLGNAVVPQVAEHLGRIIMTMEGKSPT